MSYLTHNEYEDMFYPEIDEPDFNRLLIRASDVLDSVTGDFYQFNDLETDIEYRKNQFKKAVACQIEYFHEIGATTSHGLNEPGTVTIGRTTLSSGSRGSAAQQGPSNKLVSGDAKTHLSRTGLLYTGIGVS